MTINMEKLTAAVIAAITSPQEDRVVTWEHIFLSIGKISRLTAKVIKVLEDEEPLIIEMASDNRDINEDKLVTEIIATLKEQHGE